MAKAEQLKKALYLFGILTACTIVADRLLFVLVPNYLLETGLSSTEIGAVFSIAFLVLVLFRFVIGKISDALGRKWPISLGMLIESIAIALFPSFRSITGYGLAKAIKEVGETLRKSVKDALIADVFEEKQRIKILSKLVAITPLSRAVGSLIGFVVTAYLTITHGFYTAAVFVFIGFLAFTLFFKEPHIKAANHKFKIKKPIRNTALLALIGFFVSISFTSAYFPGVFSLAKNIGITTQNLFLLILVSYLISTTTTYKSKKLVEHLGFLKTVFVMCAIFSIITALYGLVYNILHFFLVFTGLSIFFFIWQIGYRTATMNLIPAKQRGGQIGVIKTVQGLGDMIGPVFGGFIADTFTLNLTFFTAGVFGLLGALTAYILYKTKT